MALHVTATLRRLLFAPGSVFEERTPRRGSGAAVVAAVAAAHVVVLIVWLSGPVLWVGVADPGVGVGEAVTTLAGAALGAGLVVAVLVFVNWLLVSAVLHVGVKLRHGEGTFGDTLFIVAWSSPVALLLPLVTVLGAALVVGRPESVEAASRQFETAREAVGGVSFLAAVAVLCWQGYIWKPGLERLHGVRGGDAIIPIAATVLLGLLAALANV